MCYMDKSAVIGYLLGGDCSGHQLPSLDPLGIGSECILGGSRRRCDGEVVMGPAELLSFTNAVPFLGFRMLSWCVTVPRCSQLFPGSAPFV